MAGAETIERLRQYLSELSPQARALLIGEFERSLLSGDEAAGADLVLQQLRGIVREQRDGAPRIGHCARLVFEPLEPFLVDDRPDHDHPGRVARASLERLWTWIRRDLLPADAKNLAEAVNDAMLDGDTVRAEHVTRAFQDMAAAAIEASLTAGAEDEKMRRRMLAQIGTAHASEDATTLKCVLAGRDALAAMAADLPLRITNLANGALEEYKALIEKMSARNGELFLYALLMVMSRLAAPWQVIRFGVKAAGSDVAARVAETHYGVTVTIVFAELERLVGELRGDLASGRGVAVSALLKTIHDTARGLRTELDLPVDSSWGRSLANLRAQVAELAALRNRICARPGAPAVAAATVDRNSCELRTRCRRSGGDRGAADFRRQLPLFRGRVGPQRDDAAHLLGDPTVSRQRNVDAARWPAPCRQRRPQLPPKSGRRRGALLRQSVRWRICRAAQQGLGSRGCDRAQTCIDRLATHQAATLMLPSRLSTITGEWRYSTVGGEPYLASTIFFQSSV